MTSGVLDQETDGRREPVPALELALQLFPAFARERVHLRASAELGVFPLGANPSLLFEPVERRIQRTLTNGERIAGEEPDALRDAPAVERFARDRLED